MYLVFSSQPLQNSRDPQCFPLLFLFLSLVPRFSFSGAWRRGGVAVPPFLHLAPLFALRQISSSVTYSRLPFHLLFDLMHHNEGKRPRAALPQLRASTKTHWNHAPVKPPSLHEYGCDAAQGEDTRPPDRLPSAPWGVSHCSTQPCSS